MTCTWFTRWSTNKSLISQLESRATLIKTYINDFSKNSLTKIIHLLKINNALTNNYSLRKAAVPVSVQFVLPSPGNVIFEMRLDRSVAEIFFINLGLLRINSIRFRIEERTHPGSETA